ncbi:hypothetical protein F4802DRAFT_566260 [Xylaria palmicola]|nr:hypothetical protein F4802DRAFT_566260 [Xylaria palmicola]
MENFIQDISDVLPIVSEAKTSPASKLERQTHHSLPKLIIQPYQGRAPRELPTHEAKAMVRYMAAVSNDIFTFLPLPLPVFPPPPERNVGSRYEASRLASPGLDDEQEETDPYLVDPPTPATLQFTEIEAREMAQWQEVVVGLREAHSKAVEKMWEDPRDRETRAAVRSLRAEREKMVKDIEQSSNCRQIRKQFRKDFNDLLPGW